MIEITPDEALVLAKALRDEADRLWEESNKHPLRSEDPDTARYVLKDQARDVYERARDLRIKATDAKHDA